MIWIDHEVSHHLSRLRVLDMNMLLLTHGLHEILMHQFPYLPPCFAIVHDEKVITLSYQSGYDGFGAVAEYVTLFIKEILDKLAVGNDERGVGEPLEAEYTAKLSRPLCQPGHANLQPLSLELRDPEKLEEERKTQKDKKIKTGKKKEKKKAKVTTYKK